MINTASIINVPFLRMKEDLDAMVAGGVRYFHIDLMDGHYVPNLCMPIKLIRELKDAYPQVVMDVHVMVTDPCAYIERLKEAGADYVAFHTDSTNFVRRTINEIHKAGMKAGIVINPSQRIDHIAPYAEYVDMVMLMAVEPGFAGQPLLEGSMERLQGIADLRRQYGCKFLISVDGGIDQERCLRCREIGVDMIVGTVHNIFKQPDGLKSACMRFEREFGETAGGE